MSAPDERLKFSGSLPFTFLFPLLPDSPIGSRVSGSFGESTASVPVTASVLCFSVRACAGSEQFWSGSLIHNEPQPQENK